MTESGQRAAAAPYALVGTGSEREILTVFLDRQRAAVVRKVGGLPDEQARVRHVPSMTTLAGVLRHLIGVERHWFLRVLAQTPEEQMPPGNNRGLDDSWVLDESDNVERLTAGYVDACAASRAAAERFPLDHAVPHHRLGTVSLRWIYAHMIEETARHAGHADIIRELTDGSTGVTG